MKARRLIESTAYEPFDWLARIVLPFEGADARRLVVESARLGAIRLRIGIVHKEDRVVAQIAAYPAGIFRAYDGGKISALLQAARLIGIEPYAVNRVLVIDPELDFLVRLDGDEVHQAAPALVGRSNAG